MRQDLSDDVCNSSTPDSRHSKLMPGRDGQRRADRPSALRHHGRSISVTAQSPISLRFELDHLSHAENDTLIRSLFQRLEAAERRIADLEARLGGPGKTPDNSSLPPSKGQKSNKPQKAERGGPRQGSLGRQGGGRPLTLFPDETVTTRTPACAHCQAALCEADQVLHGRYDKIDLPLW
jgi:hypothetical protein